jgi:hypothetical protein
MAAPRKPYTIAAPVTDDTAYKIDKNFDAVFDQVVQISDGVTPVAKGGTGKQSYQKGDLLYADTQVTLAGLHDVVTGNVVLSGGVGVKPAYGKVALSGSVTHITGILPAPSGGTGFGSYAVGDVLYASTTTALAKLADVATGNALISGGITTAPSWGKVGLTTHVSGVLPIANGGTNLSSYTQGDLIYASATDVLAKLAKDTNATRYLSNTGSSNAPAWAQVSLTQGVTGTLPVTNGGTGLATVAQGDLLYGSASNTLSALAKSATATRYLANTGTSNNPAWSQVSLANGVTGTLPVTSGGTGLATVAQGDLLYASAADTISALAKNTSSTRYLSNTGSSNSPAWAQIALTSGVTGQLPATNGGTGQSAYGVGDILYADSIASLAALPKSSSATRYLSNTGTSNVPAWAQVNLANGVTGSLAESAISNDTLLARVADNEVVTGQWRMSNGLIIGSASSLSTAATTITSFHSGAFVIANWYDSSVAADTKWWQLVLGAAAGRLTWRLVNDAGSVVFDPLYIDRTGVASASVNIQADTLPVTDNAFNLGAASFRWKLVRGVTITPGDLRMANRWTITEHDKIGLVAPRGLAFLDENDDLAAFLARGVLYVNEVRPLSELPWKKTTHAQRAA